MMILDNIINIYNIKNPPIKNEIISIIALCISYNYFDTLKFMLPVNYLHFEKMYIITQEDDVETINFCKKFDNVILLFYNFKIDNKKFDKYGALNYGQEIIFKDHPHSWYLTIDSDIILPNNFIDILKKENLNSECLYGAYRLNIFKTSELLNKENISTNSKNIKWRYNDILWWKNNPPSILGCFQLYKKKHIFHRNLNDAGFGDYFFGHDNFNLFCNLNNLIYFHLGEICVNWFGKVTYFEDDINISINNIYFLCYRIINNVYYDHQKKLVKFSKINNINKIINKKYTWGDSSIIFLKNFKMNAFGKGVYKIIDDYSIFANFGTRNHFIIFSYDFKIFTSIREDDLIIVTGKMI
jgi:hypothetical protein